MKNIYILLSLLVTMSFLSCEKDNYDAPGVTLSGAILYQGDTIYVKNNEASIQLYETGWPTSSTTYTNIVIAQGGTFKAAIFSGGNYKMIRSTIGPWELPTAADTISFVANSKNIVKDIEVKPFFMLKNANITVAKVNNQNIVTANFDVTQISADAVLEYAQLCLFPNYIIDYSNNKVDMTNSDSQISGRLADVVIGNNTITKTITESSLTSYNFIYGRIALKIKGTSALLYSRPFKLTLN